MSDEKYLDLTSDEVGNQLNSLTDEQLSQIQFSFPMYSSGSTAMPHTDEDGFVIKVSEDDLTNFAEAQRECRKKFETNPQISSHVRDYTGRLAGWGFSFSSQHYELDSIIEYIVEDPRNDLYQNFPKFCGRSEMEGELFLMLTLHSDGFVEVDFVPPSYIGNGGDENSGINFHPTKTNFPLFYHLNFPNGIDGVSGESKMIVPSINLAYYKDLYTIARNLPEYKEKYAKRSKTKSEKFKDLHGFYRFIIQWDRSFLNRRNVSHIRTTIEWVNHYESLKKYEIDHKKSSGAYLWVVTVEDAKSFKGWLNLSKEEKEATGIMQPKTPGGTMVMPPGLKLEVKNPNLPSISDQDNDIMKMISSGLQKTQDQIVGDYSSSYASVRASQGPQGDRINDELSYFKNFLTYTFWRSILYLHHSVTNLSWYKRVEEVVDFKNGEPVKRKVKKPIYKLVDICLPTSALENIESTATALLGSKHGSVVDTLGIPPSEVAKRLGFNNYHHLRRMSSSEYEKYPEVISGIDQESAQETKENNKIEERSKNSGDKNSDGDSPSNKRKRTRTK